LSAGERLPGTIAPTQYWTGSGGVRIAGDVWGDPNGPLVMLLHGVGQTRHSWRGTGEQLGSEGYHVVAYDARGHGDSEWAPTYDWSVMANDAKAIASALSDHPPILVGASMGGTVGMIAIGEKIMQAAALVVIDIAPLVAPQGSRRIREFMTQKPEGFASLEEVADAISGYRPERKKPRSLDGLAKNVRRGSDGRYRWHWDPEVLNFRRNSQERRDRLEASARKLDIPTLLVRGAMSDMLTEEGVAHFRTLCPHSEYVSVEGATHMVAGDRNDLFGNAIRSFLNRASVI
jgi:non-heme chloroperoxidase